MGSKFGDKVKGAVEGALGLALAGALLLGVGWFVGFRPINWVMDVANAAHPTDTTPQAPVSRPVPAGEPVEQQPAAPPQEATPDRWECFWDPTMNENWHDDVLCRRGLNEYDRPLLLTDRNYVTENDMRIAAADYEARLNSR